VTLTSLDAKTESLRKVVIKLKGFTLRNHCYTEASIINLSARWIKLIFYTSQKIEIWDIVILKHVVKGW